MTTSPGTLLLQDTHPVAGKLASAPFAMAKHLSFDALTRVRGGCFLLYWATSRQPTARSPVG